MPAGIRGDVAKLHRKVDRVQRQFDGRELAQTVKEIGTEAQKDALGAVRRTTVKRGTLADLSMSGWWRRKPVKLNTRQTPRVREAFASALITPDRTAGLWRVLEDGRTPYKKGDRRAYEARVTKTMGVRTYKRKVKRNTGATEAKGTWTAAVEAMMAGTSRRGRHTFQRSMSRAVRA